MAPTRVKRKRSTEGSSPGPSAQAGPAGQSSLRAFFGRPRSGAGGLFPSPRLGGPAALCPPASAEQEEQDLRHAIEASMREASTTTGQCPSGAEAHLPAGAGLDRDGKDGAEASTRAVSPQTSSRPATADPHVIAVSDDEEAEGRTAPDVHAHGIDQHRPKEAENNFSAFEVKEEFEASSADHHHLARCTVKKEETQVDYALDGLDQHVGGCSATVPSVQVSSQAMLADAPAATSSTFPKDDDRKPPKQESKLSWLRLGLGRSAAAETHSKNKSNSTSALHGTEISAGKGKPKRPTPFYKVLRGMPLSVDAFTYGEIEGCQGYFLSHFHSDHYGSLGKNWSHGPIYCSSLTAALCHRILGVDPHFLRPMPFNVSMEIPHSGGVWVTLIPANHCPGSAIFLFEGACTYDLVDKTYTPPSVPRPNVSGGSKMSSGSGPIPRIARYLHCGDFRASPAHVSHPSVAGKRLDLIYLDTTYCNPKYTFPPQPLVIQACVDWVLTTAARLLPLGASVPGTDTTNLPPLQTSQQLTLPFGASIPAPKASPPPRLLDQWCCRSTKVTGAEPSGSSLDLDSVCPTSPSVQEEQKSLKAEQKQEDEETASQVRPPLLTSRRDLCADSGLVVLIGTYTIGKERLVLALAEALGTKIFCANQRQARMWKDVAYYAEQQKGDPAQQKSSPSSGESWSERILMHEETALAQLPHYMTSNPSEAGLHVLRLGAVNPEQSRAYLAQLNSQRVKQKRRQVRHAVSIRPTGWTFRPPAATSTASTPPAPSASTAAPPPAFSAYSLSSPSTIATEGLHDSKDTPDGNDVLGVDTDADVDKHLFSDHEDIPDSPKPVVGPPSDWSSVLRSTPAQEKSLPLPTLLSQWQGQGYAMHEITRTRGSGDGLDAIAVPYSEHSSFVRSRSAPFSIAPGSDSCLCSDKFFGVCDVLPVMRTLYVWERFFLLCTVRTYRLCPLFSGLDENHPHCRCWVSAREIKDEKSF